MIPSSLTGCSLADWVDDAIPQLAVSILTGCHQTCHNGFNGMWTGRWTPCCKWHLLLQAECFTFLLCSGRSWTWASVAKIVQPLSMGFLDCTPTQRSLAILSQSWAGKWKKCHSVKCSPVTGASNMWLCLLLYMLFSAHTIVGCICSSIY